MREFKKDCNLYYLRLSTGRVCNRDGEDLWVICSAVD